MTDTQEGMLEENYAEFMQWFCAAPTEEILSPIAVWGAATAQSAKKIARLEAENARLRDEKELRYVGRAIYEITCNQLAAAELSNKQLLGYLYQLKSIVPEGFVVAQNTINEALAQQPSTEALDAYVAKLHKWQPIETAPKDGTEIAIHSDSEPGIIRRAKWGTFAGRDCWITATKGKAISNMPSIWMPLPPAPEKG